MNEQNKKVPTVRFKGFTNDWEQHKLGDIANIGDGLHGTPKYDANGKYHFINGNNLIDGKIQITKETKRVSYSALSDDDKSLDNLTLLMSINGTIGQLAFYNKEPIKLGKSVAYIRFGNLSTLAFYYGALMASNTQQYFNRRVTGTTIKNLGLNEIRNFKYPIPSETEQKKIGKLIKLLNATITLQQRKLDLLKQLKKGLLQKMFADKGSKRPILRFNGFTDDWEQRKLGEVAEIKTGSRNHQDSVDNGKYPFFVRSEKVERLNEYDFDTKAILVPGDGRIGEIFHYYDGKFALHQRVYKVDNFKEVNPLYLLNLFKYKFKKHALSLNAQGTVPSLRLPMFTNWNILIPNLNEQQKIGLFFQQLDSLIALQQRKQNHLKLLKKSLLQQMFM